MTLPKRSRTLPKRYGLMAFIHALTLPCSEKAARHFRAAFSPILKTLPISKSNGDKFLTTLSEVVTNLVKYPDPLPTLIRLELRRTRAHWELTICDNGPRFSDLEAAPEPPMLDPLELAENGRGLYILHQQFPSFTYQSEQKNQETWNTLTLSIPLDAEERLMPTALVVDDDPVFLQVLSGYLRDTFSVQTFSKVSGALAYLEENAVDLVISDIHMPDTDGYVFRRKLQNLRKMDTVPFIYLTGSQSGEIRDKAADFSIDDYLTKPVQKKALVSSIRRIMKRAADLRSSIGDRLDDQITQALKPDITTQPTGYAIASANEAASAGGGDILIDHQLESGHLIILADIMGHGEQAKFFAHAFSGYSYGALRALGRTASPAILLSELSDMFLNDKLLKHSFATALALFLRPDGTVTIASSGHPPPFIIDGDQITEIDVGGPLLGLMEEPSYQEVHLSMQTNQRLVLYTDGVSEANRSMVCNPSHMISDFMDQLDVISDPHFANGLLESAQARNNYVLLDDATSVVIRKTA